MADASQHPSTFTQRALKWTVFLAATGLVVYFCLLIVRPFLNVIAWSSVLVITFHPVYQRLVRKTGRVSLSAFVCSVMVVVAFVIPLLFLTAVAVDQFAALGASLQQMFTDQTGPMAWAPLRQAYEWLSDRLGLDGAEIVAWVRQHASELTRVVAGYTLAAAQNVAGAVVSFVFVIFAMFLLFRDGDRIVARIPDLLPFERARSEALLTRVRDVIYGSVYGVVVIAVVQGALCGGIFWILGIPSAALWGMVTVVTSVLPVVGAAGVWAPGAVYLAATGHWTRAIILAVFGTAVISTVDNFLRPRLVGGRVGLSELVMFFSLLGGLQVFGVLGIVLGTCALCHRWGDPGRLERRNSARPAVPRHSRSMHAPEQAGRCRPVTLETLKNKLLTLGIPGLFLISFLDSAGVPLPGGADLVVMLLSWQRPAHLFLIAVVAALGSVLGSLVLYHIARTKGDAMMSRFPKDKQDRVKEKFRRNDILALLVAMLGPPPLPTKFFVLVAGVVRMDWRRFVATVFAGRLIRFLGEAYLAVKLGDRAAETLKEHYPAIAGALAAAVVLFLLLRRFVQRGPKNDRAR